MVLFLTLQDGHQEIIDLPPGEDPDEVAGRRGAVIYDLFGSRAEALAYISVGPDHLPGSKRSNKRGRKPAI